MIIRRWICKGAELLSLKQSLIANPKFEVQLPETLEGTELEIIEFPELIKAYSENNQTNSNKEV